MAKLLHASLQLDPPNVPVTSLLLFEDFLFSGQGSFFHLFSLKSQLKKCMKIFTSVNIHGIVRNSYCFNGKHQFCFFGSRFFRTVTFDNEFQVLEVSKEKQTTYWISDCCWVKYNSPDKINKIGLVLYFGNNSVALFDVETLEMVGRVECEESCILYSAKLLFEDGWKGVVALGGTVFNQVVTWSIEISLFFQESSSVKPLPVLHRLSAHKGVISGLDWNQERKEFCSVSDDRSIRVWKMLTLPEYELSSNDDFEMWKTCKFHSYLTLFGHTSRVWRAKLLKHGIVSIGEDAICAVWNYDGHMIQKFVGHKGKNIWSFAVNENTNEIYTGGGDGGIRVWRSSFTTPISNTLSELSTTELPMKTLIPPFLQQKDFPRIIRLIGDSKILVMSDRGSLCMYERSSNTWLVVMENEKYSSYCIIEPNNNLITVANIQGWLLILQVHGMEVKIVHEEKLYNGKIYSINWLSQEEFLTTGPEGDLAVWKIINPTSQLACLQKVSQHLLPQASQRWVSAAAFLPNCDILLCGDRVGSIHGYDYPSQVGDQISPAKTFHKVFGSSGVTHISCHDNQAFCCGRNGQVHVYEGSSTLDFNLLHVFNVYKGFDWLSKIIFTDDDQYIIGFLANKFVIFSICTNQFLMSFSCGGGHRMWDVDVSGGFVTFTYIKKREVVLYENYFKVERSILQPSSHGMEITSVLHLRTKTSMDYVCDFLLTSGEDGTINQHSFWNSSSSKNFTTLSVDSSRHEVTSLKAHNAVVKEMCAVHVDTCSQNTDLDDVMNVFLFTAGAGGIIKSWILKIAPSCKSQICSKELQSGQDFADGSVKAWFKFLSSHVLSEKNKKRCKPWRNYEINEMLETRYMSIDVISQLVSGIEGILVFAGCSLGFVRVFCFDKKTSSFELIKESGFHEHCLLKIKQFIHRGDVWFLSAATDGQLAFWQVSDVIKNYQMSHHLASESSTLKANLSQTECDEKPSEFDNSFLPVSTFKSHQSGVNAVDIIHIPDGDEFLIASGGDDNALCLAVFDVSAFSVTRHANNLSAHSSQITGVKFLSEKHFVSVSIDQRLSVWFISNLKTLKMTLVKCMMLDVGDISDITVATYSDCDEKKVYGIYVVGDGIQRIVVSLDNPL